MAIRRFSGSSLTTGSKSSKLWDQETTLGTFESIATATVDSGGASSITFSSIPATYTHLQIRMYLNSAATNDVGMYFNGDNNSAWHYLKGDGANATAGASTYQAGSAYTTVNGTSTSPGGAITDILDYSNTSKFKTARTLGGYDANGSGQIALRSSYWASTAAITSVTIVAATSNFTQYSSFALYGIKGA